MTAPGAHECSFPVQPPRGSFLAPGPCEVCGKPYGGPRAARGELETAIVEGLGKAWRTALAHAATDWAGRGVPLGYPETSAETERILAAADAFAAAPEPEDEAPGYWRARSALTTAVHALVMIAAGGDADLAVMARDTLGKVDAIMGRDAGPADVFATKADWTFDPETGRTNASPVFRRLVGEVDRLLRGGAGGVVLGESWTSGTAALIVAQLAHVHHLAPTAPESAPHAPGRPTTSLEDALLRNVDDLGDLVRDMLEAFPDTSGEQEWRDRAGRLDVHDTNGQPYRAYTEEDL